MELYDTILLICGIALVIAGPVFAIGFYLDNGFSVISALVGLFGLFLFLFGIFSIGCAAMGYEHAGKHWRGEW